MKKMTQCLFVLLCFMTMNIVAQAQEKKTVTGVVTDSTGKTLEGATIREKGTNNVVISDSRGAYSIRIQPNASLVVSYVGLGETELKTSGVSTYNVTMKEGQNALEGVVVTALGIRREQRKLGYATSTVAGKDIIKTAPTNFASALTGKAPGVQVNTQAGGATSAVSIQIRGINSLSYQREPLLVVDGIIIRNGGANNEGYWGGNQKLNGNGLLDINPENIESINILKGAAATALYGSDANFGVIVVTTKNGKGYNKGVGVDLNLSGNIENVALTPDLQTIYGPGYDRATNVGAFGSDDEGWIHQVVNGQNVVRPIFRAYGQFGPKMDGRQVYWWDGQMRAYNPQPNNWKEFYQTGYSTVANVAINNATDKMNYRFSYTRNDYKGIQVGGNQQKNTFNLNSSYKIIPKVSLDVVASYVNEKVHNRPRQIYYLTNNFGGFFSPAEHMDVLFNKYQTTKGYKWVDYNQTQLDPEEALKYNIRPKDFLDFLWNQLANNYDETTNRLIASATINYNIAKGLNLRGRYGTDYTGYYQETKGASTQPLSFGATGNYSVDDNRYIYNYGDVLLSYAHGLTKDLNLNLSLGYQARKEDYRYSYAGTRDGLTTENWFSLNASKTNPAEGRASRGTLVKDGLFGIVGLDYHNYLFLEGTLRKERASTLSPDNNTFYYPGASAAFELSNAFNLPALFTYSKLRASWAIVGNPPDRYLSNVVYDARTIQGVPILTPPASGYGNQGLKNEEKHEIEFGWDNRFLQNRLGLDITYYNDKIVNQIMPLTTPATVGATSVFVNVGDMRNYGVEVSLYGTPVRSKSITWDSRLNLSFNRNKVESLMEGLDHLVQANIDNGSLLVYSKPGEAAGNIYVYKRKKDAQGNYIVEDNGFYSVDYENMQKAGNVQAKMTGGFINTVTYKNLSLNFLIDFRYGGQVVSAGLLYGTGAGMYTNSLFGRDAEHGGLPYYVDANGNNVQVANNVTTGPNGQKVYHDGMVLEGVKKDGHPNTTVIDAPNYYLSTYTWGSWPGYQSGSLYEGAVFNNDYIKLREVALSYTVPVSFREKAKMQNLVFTVYGRNLFYFYKTLPYLDAEEGVGTDWVSRSTSYGSGSAATRSMGASIRLTF
jgi:iron complex outermembrane recepter protein